MACSPFLCKKRQIQKSPVNNLNFSYSINLSKSFIKIKSMTNLEYSRFCEDFMIFSLILTSRMQRSKVLTFEAECKCRDCWFVNGNQRS